MIDPSTKNPNVPAPKIRLVLWDKPAPPTQEEVEARLNQEGYSSFVWNDVPDSHYPTHQHSQDECIWLIRGKMEFVIEGQRYSLKPGDRLYLPANTPHTAQETQSKSITYLLGKKK